MPVEWYVRAGNKEFGPFGSSELKQLAVQGRINRATLLRPGLNSAWFAAGRVAELFPADTLSEGGPQTPEANVPGPPPVPGPPIITASTLDSAIAKTGNRGTRGVGIYVAAIVGVTGAMVIGLVSFVANRGDSPLRPSVATRVDPSEPAGLSRSASRPAATSAQKRPAETTATLEPPSAPRQAVPSTADKPRVLSTEEVVARASPSIAFIKGKFSRGTGFLVRPRVLVTNKHVIDMELVDAMEVHFPSAKGAKAASCTPTLIYEDDSRDLAFLAVSTALEPLGVAAEYTFRRGQEVIVIGNPGVKDDLVLENAISRGLMSTQTTIDGHAYFQLGISINPGNSGGPVLDLQGQVIGVVTLKASEKEGLGFCIPLADLVDSENKMSGTTKEQVAANQSRHRLRTVFQCVAGAAGAYKMSMKYYVETMELAIEKGLEASDGLRVASQKVNVDLTAANNFLVGDLKKEIAKISTDGAIPESTREKFVDLWTTYLELKSYIDNPRGSLSTYKAKFNELSDKFDRLLESLKLTLGLQ